MANFDNNSKQVMLSPDDEELFGECRRMEQNKGQQRSGNFNRPKTGEERLAEAGISIELANLYIALDGLFTR